MCKVSVIMPIHNEEKYVAAAVNAVLLQTMRDFELILVDDGSTDNTAVICRELAEKDARILFISKQNKGVSSARNTGMDEARGKYIYFTDADDFIDPSLLEDICRIAEDSSADIVEFGFYKEIYNSRNRLRRSQEMLPSAEGIMDRSQLARNICSCFGSTTYYISGHIFRKDIISGLKFADMPLAEDTIFVIDALKMVKKVAFCRKAYYHYAVRIGSSVNRWQPRRLECDLVLMQSLKQMTDEIGCSSSESENMLIDRCAGSYLNVIYNLSMPDCRMDFGERLDTMKSASDQLRVDDFRKRFRSYGDMFDRIKIFMLRHKLEILMLIFGRPFITLVRK